MSVRITFTAIRTNARIKPLAEMVPVLETYTRKFAEAIVEETKPYPAAVAGTRYTRTYHLQRSWKVRNVSDGAGIKYEIINPVQDRWGTYYSGYVHGPSDQMAFHASHGWRNIGTVMSELGGRDTFRRGVQAIINREMGAV